MSFRAVPSRTIRLFAAFLIAGVPAAHAFDPYQQMQNQMDNQPNPVGNQQDRNPRDANTLGRPMTSTLKGAEIKEHLARINAVKSQIFEQGGTPKGATFKAADAKEGGAHSYVIEARMDQFKPQIQRQIAIQMDKAPTSGQRVEVQVEVGQDAVVVSNAKLSANSPIAPRAGRLSDLTPAAPLPPAASFLRAGLPASPSDVLKPNRPPAAGLSRPMTPAATTRRESAPTASAPAAAPRPEVVRPVLTPATMPIAMTARAAAVAIVGEGAQLPPPTSQDVEPAALIPTPVGRDLFVRAKNSADGGQRVELSGRSGDLPQAMKDRIKTDLGARALPARAETPVTVVVDVRPDHSIRVVEARAEGAAPVRAPAEPAKAAPMANAAPAANAAAPAAATALTAPGENAPAVPSAPGAVAAPVTANPTAPDNAAVTPFPSVQAAKTIAVWTGLDAATVRLQPPKDATAASLVVPTRDGREIRIDAQKADRPGGDPTVRAEGRLGDFSTDVRRQVQDNLGRFNASSLVAPESTVVLETRPQTDGKVVVTAAAVRSAESPTRPPVLLWRESDAGQVAPPAAAEAARPAEPGANERGTVPDATFVPITNAPPAPEKTASGLAPAAATLATQALGLADANYDIKPAEKGALKINPRTAGRPEMNINWRAADDGRNDFDAIGKAVDFSDKIREQIYAKLRLSVENGETWATEAMKGRRQVQVSFEVDPDATGPDKVKVKEVSATMKDAARDAAQQMGLADGDFFVVNVGEQALIVLEQGKTASVRVGQGRMRLVSPDGDAKVFVIPSKTKKDTSAVLMLSRESLKANRGAIIASVGQKAAAAIREAMDQNSGAGEFILNLDPASEDKITIHAMSAGASLPEGAASPKKQKKPEDMIP